MFVCVVHRIFTPVSSPKEVDFACTAVFTPASRAVVLRLQGDLICVLRICLYRREAIEGEKGGRECQFYVVEEAGVPTENHRPSAGY